MRATTRRFGSRFIGVALNPACPDLSGIPSGVVPLRILLRFGDLLKDLKFAVFDNQYNRIINRIADRVKRELTQNGIKICDVR